MLYAGHVWPDELPFIDFYSVGLINSTDHCDSSSLPTAIELGFCYAKNYKRHDGVNGMTNRHQERAEKIVTAFKQSLDPNVAEQITKAQFTALTVMIKEAMGEELGFVAEQLEQVIRQLRADSERRDLGM